MKKILLIDGYNAIHLIPELEKKLTLPLEAARNGLIEICRQFVQERGDIEKVVIVFDGKKNPLDFYPISSGVSGIEIIFSEPNQSADDKILEILEDAAKPQVFIAVSNDNYIINNARAYGVKIISVQEFQRAVQKPVSKAKPSKISEGQAKKITDEYRNHLGIKD